VVPRATLYRHVATLVAEGCLVQEGRSYRTTPEGLRRLAVAESAVDWAVLDRVYPPLQVVPTVQHRAVIELILAAIAARRASLREDHHPSFVLFGHTLAWKTSLARFVCAMLGLSPSIHLIDLSAESGQSLWLRRDARGEVMFQREILTAPFLALDEYLEAEAKVRTIIQHFLSGRISLPFENGVLRIEPVCLVTMNARPKPSLEGRTTFSAPQLRRLVLCDVDHIPLPDLALLGERPLQAAAEHPPIQVPPPRVDCQQYRPQIVRLVRDLLTPDAQSLVDVEMVILLCAGMTAFIEEDERAIQQAVYDLAVVLQTLGWVQLDWVAVVSAFSLYATPAAAPPLVPLAHTTTDRTDTIILRRPIMEDRDSLVPQFSISEKQKARLIWLSEQEGIPVEHALDVLLDSFQLLGDRDLDHLNNVVRLSKELKRRELPAWAVSLTLKLMEEVTKREQTLDDFEAALDLLPALRGLGLTLDSVPGADTIHIAAQLTANGVTITEVERWLARRLHRRRTAAPPDSGEAPRAVASRTAEGPLERSERPDSADLPQ
jgi:hypothetical protein